MYSVLFYYTMCSILWCFICLSFLLVRLILLKRKKHHLYIMISTGVSLKNIYAAFLFLIVCASFCFIFCALTRFFPTQNTNWMKSLSVMVIRSTMAHWALYYAAKRYINPLTLIHLFHVHIYAYWRTYSTSSPSLLASNSTSFILFYSNRYFHYSNGRPSLQYNSQ